MTLANLLECSRPLLFKNEDQDFPYSCGGTCFLVRYRGAVFVITTRHCLRDREIQKTLIGADAGTRDFLPFRRFHVIDPLEGEENDDWRDLAFFEVASTMLAAAGLGSHLKRALVV